MVVQRVAGFRMYRRSFLLVPSQFLFPDNIGAAAAHTLYLFRRLFRGAPVNYPKLPPVQHHIPLFELGRGVLIEPCAEFAGFDRTSVSSTRYAMMPRGGIQVPV